MLWCLLGSPQKGKASEGCGPAPLEDGEALFIGCGSEKGDEIPPEVQQVNIHLGLDPLKGFFEAAAGL